MNSKNGSFHRVCSYLREMHRNYVFRRALNRYLKNPEAFTHAEDPIFRDLIYGWGNEEWSGLGDYLAGCIGHALTTNGPILECGSGLSTLLVGAVASKRGIAHWAFEHTPAWAALVQKYLSEYHLDSVVLRVTPLKDYGEYSWYDVSSASLPDHFALVVCDGPPSSTKGGRYGLVPVMKDRLKPGCLILLDDANREAEQFIAKRWALELNASVKFVGTSRPFMELVVG